MTTRSTDWQLTSGLEARLMPCTPIRFLSFLVPLGLFLLALLPIGLFLLALLPIGLFLLQLIGQFVLIGQFLMIGLFLLLFGVEEGEGTLTVGISNLN